MKKVFLHKDAAALVHADCLVALRELPEDSIDAVVTDPPYDIGFAGKEWDATGIAFRPETWAEVLRVLKPGGHLLAFGGTRTYHRMAVAIEDAGFVIRDSLHWITGQGMPHGENLKPAHEPIVLARKGKKCAGTLNTDSCRTPEGRYPANLLIDQDAAEELDAQSGVKRTSATNSDASSPSLFRAGSTMPQGPVYGDEGGASRFFNVFRYVPKANRKEREAGCEDLPERAVGMSNGAQIHGAGYDKGQKYGYNRVKRVHNHHTTVKPIAVMDWLVSLVARPGELVLDPFMGSGTTGIVCVRRGVNFIGIEREADYFDIAEARVRHAGSQETECTQAE